MSMKKTDLEKRLAKKIEGRQKTALIPQRFGKGSAAPSSAKPAEPGADAAQPAADTAAAMAPAVGKPVTLSVRMPAALAQRLRAQAVRREGGISAVVAEAVEQWLARAGSRAAGKS